MDGFRELAFFTVTIGGVEFEMRRRSTALMLQIGDVGKVFGLLAAGRKETETPADVAKAAESYRAMLEKTMEVALTKIAGKPIAELDVSPDELIHVADPLFSAFMDSGLKADPTPGSSKGAVEPT